MKIKWLDGNREPKQLANKMFPDGIDIDLSNGQKACTVALPYPAKRVGHYYIECEVCGTNALITTTGRSDDPRSIKIACK